MFLCLKGSAVTYSDVIKYPPRYCISKSVIMLFVIFYSTLYSIWNKYPLYIDSSCQVWWYDSLQFIRCHLHTMLLSQCTWIDNPSERLAFTFQMSPKLKFPLFHITFTTFTEQSLHQVLWFWTFKKEKSVKFFFFPPEALGFHGFITRALTSAPDINQASYLGITKCQDSFYSPS